MSGRPLWSKNSASRRVGEEIFSRAFVCIAAVNLMLTMSFQGLTTAMPLYVSELGSAGFAMGLSTAVATVASLFARAFVGPVLDRFGCKGVLVAAMLVTFFSVCMYAVAPVVSVILFFRAINGIGLGLGTSATATMAAKLLPKARFAEGLGYFAMTSSIAGAIGPALLLELMQGPGSIAMIGAAAVLSFAALTLSLFAKDTTAEEEVSESSCSHCKRGINRFFERRAFVPAVSMALVNIGFASIITFVAAYASSKGIQSVYIYFVIYALTNMATRPFIGKIIDRRGVGLPGVIACLCMTAVLLVIGVADSLWELCIAGVLAGLGQGTCMGAFQTMAVASSSPSRCGVATSTFLFGFDLGIAVGSILSGAIAQTAGYGAMYSAMSLAPFAASVLFAVVSRKHSLLDA